MKLTFYKHDVFIGLSVVFLITNVSAYFTSFGSRTVTEYLNYLVAVLTVFIFGLILLLKQEIHKEMISFGLYAALILIKNQFLNVTNTPKKFGIAQGTILLIQVVATLLLGFFMKEKASRRFYKAVVITYAIVSTVDIIHTFNVISVNSEALRISTMTSGEALLESNDMYGICNILHINAFLTMIPVLICFIKSTSEKKANKIMCIVFLIMIISCIVVAGFTIAILMMVVYFLYKLISGLKNRYMIIAGIVLAVVLIIAFSYRIGEMFLYLSDKMSSESVSERFVLIGHFLQGQEMSGDLLGRIRLYQRGITGFANSPILGNVLSGKRMTSGHSTIIDLASDWGIIGLSAFIIALIQIKNKLGNGFDSEKSVAFNEAFILSFIAMIFNPVGGYLQIYVSVFVFDVAFLSLINSKTNIAAENNK